MIRHTSRLFLQRGHDWFCNRLISKSAGFGELHIKLTMQLPVEPLAGFIKQLTAEVTLLINLEHHTFLEYGFTNAISVIATRLSSTINNPRCI